MILTTGVSSDGALANLTVPCSDFFGSEKDHICFFLQVNFKTITKHQALDNAAALASAYQIGKLEAQACTNLLKHIPPPIVEGLKELVRPATHKKWFSWNRFCLCCHFTCLIFKQVLTRIHGQPKFLLHDGIAHGVFNASYNGASNSGAVSAWENLLQNTPEVLQLLLQRMQQDWESMSPKMRRPWGLKDLEPHLEWLPLRNQQKYMLTNTSCWHQQFSWGSPSACVLCFQSMLQSLQRFGARELQREGGKGDHVNVSWVYKTMVSSIPLKAKLYIYIFIYHKILSH